MNTLQQLERAGLLKHLRNVRVEGRMVYADVEDRMVETDDGEIVLAIVDALDRHECFLSGLGHGLHRDVDNDGDVDEDRCDYRSIGGSFGRGSLQVVVSRATREFYADVDRFSPYDSVASFVGHFFGEVLPGWFRKRT